MTLREALRARGLLNEAPNPATLVSFRPKGDAEELVARMEAAGIYLRTIPKHGWVRASIGWWNNAEDLDRVLAVIDETGGRGGMTRAKERP